MSDEIHKTEAGVSLQISKGPEKQIPDYFRVFLTTHSQTIAQALQSGDRESLKDTLRILSGVLPKDESFRELDSFICRRVNGDLFASVIQGDFDTISGTKIEEEIDELIQQVPVDIKALLYIHTHPAKISIIGPVTRETVAFSEGDKKVTADVGRKLRVFDISRVYAGLSTALSRDVILLEGKNEGRAFGWSFDFDEPRK